VIERAGLAARRAAGDNSRAAGAALSGAAGLTLVAASFALRRMGHAAPWNTALFFGGVVVMLAPIAWYLAAEDTPRNHRVMLVTLAACLSYAVKVLYDPTMFILPDGCPPLGFERGIELGLLEIIVGKALARSYQP
jgi:hypothetical protein